MTGPVYYHIIFSIAAINTLNSPCLLARLLLLPVIKKGEALKNAPIIKGTPWVAGARHQPWNPTSVTWEVARGLTLAQGPGANREGTGQACPN